MQRTWLGIIFGLVLLLQTTGAFCAKTDIAGDIKRCLAPGAEVDAKNIYQENVIPGRNDCYVVYYYLKDTASTDGYSQAKVVVYSTKSKKIIWDNLSKTPGLFNLTQPVRDINKDGVSEIVAEVVTGGRVVELNIYQWSSSRHTFVNIPFIGGRLVYKQHISGNGLNYKDLNADGVDEIINEIQQDKDIPDIYQWDRVKKRYIISNYEFSSYYTEAINSQLHAIKSGTIPKENLVECYVPLINAYIYQKKYAQAKKYCQILFDAYKDDIKMDNAAEAYKLFGDIANDQGKHSVAVSDYNKAAELICRDSKQTYNATQAQYTKHTGLKTKNLIQSEAEYSNVAASTAGYEKDKREQFNRMYQGYYTVRGLPLPK